MKILSVPLPVQPRPPLLPLSSEDLGQFQPHLIGKWELQKTHSLLIWGGRWDSVPQGVPSPSHNAEIVCSQGLPAGFCLLLWRRHGWRCPFCQPELEEHQGAKSTGGGHQKGGKTARGGLGHHDLDSGKREGARPSMERRKFQGHNQAYFRGQKML